MDRKGQLRNVAFGGAWSEQIAGNEALAEALRIVKSAASLTADEDLRPNLVITDALGRIAAAHPKGGQLVAAWRKALDLPSAYDREAELRRIAEFLAAGVAARLG